MNFWLKYKKRLIWSALAFGLFAIVSLIFWFFVTPYNKKIDKNPVFYVSENQQNYTSARATVESYNNGKAIVKINDGARKGDKIEVSTYGNKIPKPGDRIILGVTKKDGVSKDMTDFWRLPGVVILAALFILLVLVVGGRRGVMSIIGLLISVVVISFGLVPAVLGGADAFLSSVLAAFAIATVAIFVAHGFKWRTVVSLTSIFIVLALSIGLAVLGGWIGHLTGVYDEVSATLKIYEYNIDLRGILIGGIVIATLGVLDDIVTAQTAAVEEIYKAQPKLGYKKLFSHGYSVGLEHIASLVNTLVLAYIGVSLPLLLIIVSNFDSSRSVLLLINSEFLSQEIIRTLVSSMALVAAVPISTAIATLLILRKKDIFAILKINKRKSGGHNAAN